MSWRALVGLGCALASAGCELYLGGSSGPPDAGCDIVLDSADPGPGPGYRDPNTGACDYSIVTNPCGFEPPVPGNAGGAEGSGGVAESPVSDAPGAGIPGVAWPLCESDCTALDESDCHAADACRAVYVDTCRGTPNDCVNVVYAACWPTSPFGPVRGGICEGLTADNCSMHDDCQPLHQLACPTGEGCTQDGAPGNYLHCEPEAGRLLGTCGTTPCAADEYCQRLNPGIPGGTTSFSCQPMPASCLSGGGATCFCVQNEPCGLICEQDFETSLITVTCQAP